MAKIGSPEWFNEKASKYRIDRMAVDTERLRAAFFDRFSPKALSEMSGEQLLRYVFGNSDSCMIRLLMFDDSYRWFGAAGKYAYLGVLYNKKENGAWAYKESAKAIEISYREAIAKAEYIRDKLIECVNSIVRIGRFTTIYDYEKLDRMLKGVFFSKYAWVTKYFQMLFPQFFPGMYADDTLGRAIAIIGLPDHGSRILNMGEIALFIRRCDINNILFNTVYADQWTWRGNPPACESAADNYRFALSKSPVENDNVSYYNISPIEEIPLDTRRENPQIKSASVIMTRPKPSVHIEKPIDKPQDDYVMPAIEKGMKVSHGKYGEGIITDVSNDKAQIIVSFAECERKFCSDKDNEMNAFRKGFLKIIDD